MEIKELISLSNHSYKELLQEIPYHLQRMEFGAEIDGSEDFFQVNINLNSDIQTTCLYSWSKIY